MCWRDNKLILLFPILTLSAISITDGARVTLSDVDIALNQAEQGGGVFISGMDTVVVMEQVRFESNEARDGSAIFIDQSNLTIVSGEIRSNGRSSNAADAVLCNGCTLEFPQPTQVLISSNGSCSSLTCFVADNMLFSPLFQSTPTSGVLVRQRDASIVDCAGTEADVISPLHLLKTASVMGMSQQGMRQTMIQTLKEVAILLNG